MDEQELIEKLMSHDQLTEVWHKRSFEVHRKTNAGDIQMVSVDILYGGLKGETASYMCRATLEGGERERKTSGYGPTLDIAIATCNWRNLEQT